MFKLGVVVGHDMKAGGASLNLNLDVLQKYGFEEEYAEEYDYNLEVSKAVEACSMLYGIDAKIFLRDGKGINGAHTEAEHWGADVVLELHFNSCADTKVQGAEVLDCSPDTGTSKGFAEELAKGMANIFGGKSRGVKFPDGLDRGHVNVCRPIPTYLLEPFFGSNSESAEAGLRNMVPYAKMILITVKKYFIDVKIN